MGAFVSKPSLLSGAEGKTCRDRAAAGEPDLLFAEMMAKGIVSGSGYAYEQSYISLFQLDEGRITLWREYFNPIPLQEALESISLSDS